MENGFMLINYDNLLYPQYLNDEHFPSYEKLIQDNKSHLAKKAKERLKESPDAHPDVIAHWKYLASLDAAE
jgi:hypothetical protein